LVLRVLIGELMGNNACGLKEKNAKGNPAGTTFPYMIRVINLLMGFFPQKQEANNKSEQI
jgi:hypothetical protein